MEKILITGATGLIGKNLTRLLVSRGYEVVHLLRRKPIDSAVKYHLWNPEKGILDESVFDGVDHLIHLAGENISAKRWTKKQKLVLHKSRIETAELLYQKSRQANLKTFVSASGIGIYGTATTDIIYDEESDPSEDFLGQLTVAWENAADAFRTNTTRVVKLRTAVVLSETDGALAKIVRPIQLGVGSALGNGKQFFPWIHIHDLCQIYLKAIQEKDWSGVYNAVAPEHVTNGELVKKIATLLKKKIWFPPVPSWVIKLLFGEMGNLVLKGSRISSEKILKSGFRFTYPTIQEALSACLNKSKKQY